MSDIAVPDLLVRTNELLAVLVKLQLKQVLAAELADPKKKALYELTGGDLSVKELAEKVKMSTGAISKAWQSWDDDGLLIKRNGRYRRVLE